MISAAFDSYVNHIETLQSKARDCDASPIFSIIHCDRNVTFNIADEMVESSPRMIPVHSKFTFVSFEHGQFPQMYGSDFKNMPERMQHLKHGYYGETLLPEIMSSSVILGTNIVYEGNNLIKARLMYCDLMLQYMKSVGFNVFFHRTFNNLKREYEFFSTKYPEHVI